MREDLIERLRERAQFEDKRVLDEAKAMGFEPEVYTGSRTGALLREAAAALEAAREDARKWRYWANGPQGTFLTDDLELATAILAAYDKDDDWTVTDIVDPTGAAVDQARGKENWNG